MVSFLSLATSGAENRKRGHAADGVEVREGLARDLAEAVPGHERLGAELPGDAFGQAEHEAAVQDDEEAARGRVAAGLLNLGEGDHVQAHPALPAADGSRELLDLLQSGVARVGEGVEVDGVDRDPATHDRPRGHRRVDPPGEEGDHLAVGAHGEAAGAGDLLLEDEDSIFADFDPDAHLGGRRG